MVDTVHTKYYHIHLELLPCASHTASSLIAYSHYLSIHLSIYLSVYLSIYLSIYLPIYLVLLLRLRLLPLFFFDWSHFFLTPDILTTILLLTIFYLNCMQRIESVEIHLKTFSLSFFLRHLAALESKETKRKTREKEKDAERYTHHSAIVVEGGGGGTGDDDDASCSSVNSLLSSTTCNTVATTALQPSKALTHMQMHALEPGNQRRDITTTRFLPLIVDEEHADRALSLLQEELLRLDRLV